ncbi:hypothetical protein [Amycolatopsis sp. 195334CR]|uniref:hypothetical protein n=1 Tax=Amycolatopsis sp. 195334CR TaxID=2814588 RepID=UPI001A8F43A3|nr:hypothetical protein [Amycolatopsis sp. 195334CR]MBN6039110.1 hypothetical protein [Amycolatopsis sp. 195334CR]
MESVDDFDSVRRDPNPVRRGKRATELLTIYQQRATELARLRKAAIEEAHREQGMSYTEIATALGITKGRITQIRSSAPGPERAFFGVGPVSVGIPYRLAVTDRERPLIAAEDSEAGQQIEALLGSLSLAATRSQIGPETADLSPGDAVVICGPKSAPVAVSLLEHEPALRFTTDEDGRWWLEHQTTGDRYGSPTDDAAPQKADIAYIGRHVLDGRVVVHIAGIHSVGSLGAVDYLSRNLGELFGQVGDEQCSLIVQSSSDGLTITGSKLLAGPFVW